MKTWKITHKGHTIEVTNTMFRETLKVDGELQDEHNGLGLRSRLTGRIKSGDGANETILKMTAGLRLIFLIRMLSNCYVARRQFPSG